MHTKKVNPTTISASNLPSFLPVTLAEWIAIASGVATVVVILFLYKQMRQTDISLKLSYTPFISPNARFTNAMDALLSLYNIGSGAAKDIHITIFDLQGNRLHQAEPFALPANGSIDTLIDVRRYSTVRIQGSYRDLADRTHEINTVYRFP